MRLFSADLSLYEMERLLEHCFYEEENKVRIIGDLNLTNEDYKYMTLKVKGILRYISKVEVMEQYRLCILTTLVFAIRYEKNAAVILKQFEKYWNQFQQHQYRFCMQAFGDKLHEIGLSTYSIRIDSSKELMEVLFIHAGLTKNIYEKIYELLEQYFDEERSYLFEEELYERMDSLICRDYPFLSCRSAGLKVSHLLKELYEACLVRRETLEQMFENFNMLSKQVIEDCYRWCEAYGDHSYNLINMR